MGEAKRRRLKDPSYGSPATYTLTMSLLVGKNEWQPYEIDLPIRKSIDYEKQDRRAVDFATLLFHYLVSGEKCAKERLYLASDLLFGDGEALISQLNQEFGRRFTGESVAGYLYLEGVKLLELATRTGIIPQAKPIDEVATFKNLTDFSVAKVKGVELVEKLRASA